MASERNADAVSIIGRCTAAGGTVMIEAPGGAEKPLLPGGKLRAGDNILTGDEAFASLKFTDGTHLALGAATTLVIDRFSFESDTDEDAAHLTLEMGTFVIEAGDLAVNADTFLVFTGDSTLTLRSARIAVRVDPLSYDLVTLLPPQTGPLGEVLVHNKIGMQMLNRSLQTLRLGDGEEDIPAPLTLPSGVVRETYGGLGMADALTPREDIGVDDDHADAFQPFKALQDRFLERQFIGRQVFPGDGAAKTGDGDRMLEDAFEGTRFRLADPDPEPI